VAGALRGRTVLITSGPTREHLDPIRYMTNASSGRMGLALARRAKSSGAAVVVVSGPTELAAPKGVKIVRVTTALEMLREVMRLRAKADVVIGAAAVSDWRFARVSAKKVKRSPRSLRLSLIPNPDIIAAAASPRGIRPKVVVGFALETHDRRAHARRKMLKKGLDLIVVNGPASLAGKSSDGVLMTRGGAVKTLKPGSSKEAMARIIFTEVERLLEG
jgi:phosphopantothenoylcysteine decarboxylase / phosphopantothenate---cysteine ligase